MREFSKPRIVVSKCLGFEHCRYNGQIISCDIADELKGHVEFITVCPEVEIGLGVPRDPVRTVMKDDEWRLMQPATGEDHTESMIDFIDGFLDLDQDVDGFILKGSSPSCGIKDTKIYNKMEKAAPIDRDSGFFGKAVLEKFPHKAVESDGRLRNYQIREHYLTKIFTLADFRDVKDGGNFGGLEDFHRRHGLLMRSYDKDMYEEMESLMNNDHENKDISSIYEEYEKKLYNLFKNHPPCESKIEIMKEVFEDLSDDIGEDEKGFFLETVEGYNEGKNSMDVPLSILITWLMRAGKKDVSEQSFFYPYPKELVKLEDIKTCQTRDYWPF